MEHLENRWQSPTELARVKANVAPIPDIGQIVAYRIQKQESQRRFWSRFGVTQSRGSRFESGAEISAPVSILLALYFGRTISDGDLGRAGRMCAGRDPAGSTSPAL
ncbi:helix-turn-helix domain-containing protein [Paraburkholderia kururiensis]|uniref:helix-turn-helix domain-containing protein n=1 Tax=Paraburkholderia kururiensis TaxID=984307 RepID=UPI000B262985|nr:helix-turn-helix domain-containing protein [Paraburkholderia kururiensis]